MIKLMHNGLKDLLSIGDYAPGRKIGFVSLETPLPQGLKKFTQSMNYQVGLQLRREYRHVAMGTRALQFPQEVNTIFVFELYNQHLSILLPLLALQALQGKEVLISLHGNQQFAMSSGIKNLGLMYLRMYLKLFKNLKVVTLEVDDRVIPERYRLPPESMFVIPHPIISGVEPKLKPGERLPADRRVKIGVVGMIRPDKPIAKLIKQLTSYTATHPHCELVIGTPLSKKPKELENIEATLRDTTKEEDYLKVLQEIDILVIHYDRDRYYYRTSGVISDAGSCGCYIIASNYPAIEHQVKWPTPIGATFEDFEQIPKLIDEAILHLREQGQDNHWEWRKQRNAEAIAKILFPEV
ncbi:glycosyltransferase family 1 protein [Roseofilum sp. BLCC_M91]|uniref:Glycosyltransferase family 1 protein n=1 Tax=Roseofilum halophilum BLCC-M91 TaxID=3022259 RepID=A0ABT7BSD9_9CYAN|nr:hypothetical protein [Roseofilum halophilum]MDJ1181416.1 glycosyltransferase family 1 protein [Roseofilum halophilum BLCC-M91]